MANKSDKLSWREAWDINIRAIKLLNSKNRLMFPYVIAKSFLGSAFGYVSLFVMARLINELAGERRVESLIFWALFQIISAAVFALINGVMYHAYEVKSSLFWLNVHRIEDEKFMSMDYCDVEDQRVRDLKDQINQNANWAGWGFSRIQLTFEGLVSNFFNFIGAIAMSAGLLIHKVPANSPLAFMNSPLAVLGFFVLIVLTSAISPIVNAKEIEWQADISENARFGNRLFGHFGFINGSPESMADYRMYEQNNVRKHYFWKDDTWHVGGPCDKLYKGKQGAASIFSAFGEKLLTCVIYLFVCLKALGGAFGLGEVTQYVGAASKFISGFTQTITLLNNFRVNAKFLKDNFEFLDIPSKMYQGSLTTEKRRDRKYNVEFKDVSFKYPNSERWALRHVSVKFEVGTKLAVVGENGSGKSTFIKLLCRLYDPQEGEILLNGVDIRKYRYDEYIAIFSVVFQDFWLMAHKLGQNIAGSCEVDEAKAIKCLEDAGFGERLKELPDGIETWLGKDFDEEGIIVSGGERQKIAIARALYKDAPFIVLDEPTASLDPIAEAEIYQKFDEIVGDRTAIYISHRLSSCRFCKEILVFEDGGIIEHGDHEQLIAADGRCAELWDAQAKYYEKMRQYEADKIYL